MEEKRGAADPRPPIGSGAVGVLFFLAEILKRVVFPQNRTILRAVLTTIGIRIISPFIARRALGFILGRAPGVRKT